MPDHLESVCQLAAGMRRLRWRSSIRPFGEVLASEGRGSSLFSYTREHQPGLGQETMKRYLIAATVILISTVACGACGAFTFAPAPEVEEGTWQCTLPPASFQESDLIGTWHVTEEGATITDTLILRENKTYKQIYVQSSGFRYESTWNAWWVEHRQSGGMYVHFDKMRYCHSIDSICKRPNGGGGQALYNDICENRTFPMRNEVILAVVGARDKQHPLLVDAPRDIVLMHMLDESDGTTSFFYLSNE